MLNTVNGEDSLIKWENNRNGVNILQPVDSHDLDNWIKTSVEAFFTHLKDDYENKKVVSFSKHWWSVTKDFHNVLDAGLKLKFQESKKEERSRIVKKVAGNIGEIFAEYFFTHFGASWIDTTEAYVPVDPTNERFTDATATAPDGMQVGIQIKNWLGEIPSEIFWKACTENSIYLAEHPDTALNFLKRRREIILSFTDAKYSPNQEAYEKVVELIGPNEIDVQLKKNEARIDMCEYILNQLHKLEF